MYSALRIAISVIALLGASYPLCFAGRIVHSSALGWQAGDDITAKFKQGLTEGDQLILDHTYRISGTHQLPDHFILSAKKGAGLNVTDANDRGALLQVGNNNSLNNLTITYLDTPPVGPTGGRHGLDFTNRIGIFSKGKNNLLIENCRLVGSINHHIKVADCEQLKVIGTHITGGYWSVFLINVSDVVFRRCLIEKCQGDGIKTGEGAAGIVRDILVEDCVFQDNGRDGIDTTGGFNNAVVQNCIFRRMGTSGLDLKSHYEMRKIVDHLPENVGITVEKCWFFDMPNSIVVTTLDQNRRTGKEDFLTAANMKKYAAHDIDINECLFGFVEEPLRKSREGGYGVNYPGWIQEHMRMLLVKDAYNIRYRNAQVFGTSSFLLGDRFEPVKIASIGGGPHLSEAAANAIERNVTGNILNKPVPNIIPGDTSVSFAHGPISLE